MLQEVSRTRITYTCYIPLIYMSQPKHYTFKYRSVSTLYLLVCDVLYTVFKFAVVVGIGRHNTIDGRGHSTIKITSVEAVGLSFDSVVPNSVLNIHYLQEIMQVLRVAIVLLSFVVLAYPRSPDNEAEGK